MTFICAKGRLATLVKPGETPLSLVLKGGERRIISRNTLIGFPLHPLSIRDEDGAEQRLELKEKTFSPALPLVHPNITLSTSSKLKDCGRCLELAGGVFDLLAIPMDGGLLVDGDLLAEADLKEGGIWLPENGLRYLLISDIYDPARYDADSVLRYMSGIRYFNRFKRGLVKLVEIMHCLSREEEERLLMVLFHQEPEIYSLVTDLLFSLYLLPLLTRRERFEFVSALDDYCIARALWKMDKAVYEAVAESLSRRRKSWIEKLRDDLDDEPSGKSLEALSEIDREFKRYLKMNFSRILLPGRLLLPEGSSNLTVKRDVLNNYRDQLHGMLVCERETALQRYLVPVGRVQNHTVFMLTSPADLLLLFSCSGYCEFVDVPEGSYIYYQQMDGDQTVYIALVHRGALKEGAFKHFPTGTKAASGPGAGTPGVTVFL